MLPDGTFNSNADKLILSCVFVVRSNLKNALLNVKNLIYRFFTSHACTLCGDT